MCFVVYSKVAAFVESQNICAEIYLSIKIFISQILFMYICKLRIYCVNED